MERVVKTTEDGSKTLFINDLDEGYHSSHGALQEARHVFIKNGLHVIKNCEINILELGFGTGLNFLVTIDDELKNDLHHTIHYYGIEKYPVTSAEITALDYLQHFDSENIKEAYRKSYTSEWNTETEISPNFFLTKFEKDFFQIKGLSLPPINLVYFDCFGARVQPELWEKPLLEMVADKMCSGGLFTTYSSKGSVRRILQELGFEVEKKPGPPGKREMINAIKK